MSNTLINLLNTPKQEKIEVIKPFLMALDYEGYVCHGVIYIVTDLLRIELDITIPKMVVQEQCKGNRKRRYRSYCQILKELQSLAIDYN